MLVVIYRLTSLRGQSVSLYNAAQQCECGRGPFRRRSSVGLMKLLQSFSPAERRFVELDEVKTV